MAQRSMLLHILWPTLNSNKTKYSPKEVGEDTRFEVLTDNNEFMLIQHRVIGKVMLAFDSFALR